MSDPIKTAQIILAEAGKGRLPRLDVEDFADLAEDYLARAGSAQTLGQTGRLYVSLAAASAYGGALRIHNDELARQELHEILLDAKRTSDGSWRVRKRSTGLDVTARVADEGRLLVVTTVSVRDANMGGRRG